MYPKLWERSEVQNSSRGRSKERGQQEDWTGEAGSTHSALRVDIKTAESRERR